MKIIKEALVRLHLIAIMSTVLTEILTAQPLSLHPKNPHYFLFRGSPEILIGSTEHYGAVINLDFNFIRYLNELEASGLNVTRTFSGVYVEPQGAFGIQKNTLAPAPQRYTCPWKRSSSPGYANGGNKFDLSGWDKAYFQRLKEFITEAGKRNIVVELDLFSNFYDTVQWKLSPLNGRNNINGIGWFDDHKEVLSLKHPEIIEVQKKMVRKVIKELKDFDNLYYEICNEPYFGDTLALREWERYMTGIVTDAEKSFKHKHLISNNIANSYLLVPAQRTGVSVYNFHYARPPATVYANYGLNKVIGDNETGFDGINDAKYRREAWSFILAGGGLFNNLDYSFTTGNEDGSFVVTVGQPGGGGKTLRSQFKTLNEFMHGVDYINMRPADEAIVRMTQPGLFKIYSLAGENAIAAYIHCINESGARSNLEINLTGGSYDLSLTDPETGTKTNSTISNHPGGWIRISSAENIDEIAICAVRVK